MQRYLLERSLGDIDRAELERINAASTRVREEQFPDLVWEHTHVVLTEEGMTAFCVYESDRIEDLLAYVEAMGVPAQRILEIETDLDPSP